MIHGRDFGNFRPGEIRGQKFHDMNCDGVHDPNDNGLGGVTIYVDLNNNGEFDADEPSAVTDELTGNYAIQDVLPGTYIVREVVPDGFFQSFPEDVFYEVTISTSGKVVSGIDFGNFQKIVLPDGDDWIYGTDGNDTFYGDNVVSDPCILSVGGEDHLFGQAGDDTMAGQLASDTYHFDAAPQLNAGDETDIVIELTGTGTEEPTDEGLHDRLDFTELANDEPVHVDLTGTPPPFGEANQIAEHGRINLADNTPTSDMRIIVTDEFDQHGNFEELFGGDANDILIGNDADNLINGGFGSDQLEGEGGDDTFEFVIGNPTDTDIVVETIGNDTIDFSNINVPVIADLSGIHPGFGPDQIAEYGGLTVESPVPNLLENVIGGTADDEITGNDVANILDGGPGMDTINGLKDDDTLIGGPDSDTFVFDDDWGLDVVIEGNNEGTADEVNFFDVTSTLTFEMGSLKVTDGTNIMTHTENNIERMVGGQTADDTLIAHNLANTWNVTSEDVGNITNSLGTFDFQEIENLQGSTNTDDFTIFANLTGNVLGGDDVDTVVVNGPATVGGNVEVGTGNDTVTLNNGAEVIGDIEGGAGDDVFTINDGAVVTGTIRGQADNDTLIVDYLGNKNRTITFEGGTEIDLIQLTGGSAGATGTYDPGPAADAGTIRHNIGGMEQTINFAELEPGENVISAVEDVTTAASLTINASTADTINIVDGPIVMGFQTTEVQFGGNFEVIRFANKETVTINGQAGNDTFTLNNPTPADGLVNLKLDGGAGDNTLVGPNLPNTWTVTLDDAGTLNAVTFSNIQNLTGSLDQDDFTFNANLIGTAAGGGGNDTFAISAGVSIGEVDGNAGNDMFTLSPGALLTGDIDGGADDNTLIGADTPNTWIISSDDAGTVGTVTFSSIQNLVGGSDRDDFTIDANLTGNLSADGADDTIVLSAGFTVGGDVDGDGGNDSFTLSSGAQVIGMIRGGSDNDTLSVDYIGGSDQQITFDGGSEEDLIQLMGGNPTAVGVYTVGPAADEGTAVYAIGAKTLTIGFMGLEPIEDVMVADSLEIRASAAADTINIVDGPMVLGNQTTEVNFDGAFELIRFANKTTVSVVGEGGDDTITLNNPNPADGLTTLQIDGGADDNTLVGPDVVNTWTITGTAGTNSGTINSSPFSNIQNLTGGADDDNFIFQLTGRITGNLAGHAGDDLFNLAEGLGIGGTVDGGFDNDTLLGPDTGGNYNITGLNAGTVTSVGGGFTDVENLTGGADDDLFTASSGASLTGTMSGAAGNDQFTLTPDAGESFQVAGGVHSTLDGDVLTVIGQTAPPVDDGTTVTTLELATVAYNGIENVHLECATCAVGASLLLQDESFNSPLVDRAFADFGDSLFAADSTSADLEILGEPTTNQMVDGAFATVSVADNDEPEGEDVTELDQALSLPLIIPARRKLFSRMLHGRGGEESGKAALRSPVAARRRLRNQLGDLDVLTTVKKDFLSQDLLHRPTDFQETDEIDPEDGHNEHFRKPGAVKKFVAMLNTFFGFGL